MKVGARVEVVNGQMARRFLAKVKTGDKGTILKGKIPEDNSIEVLIDGDTGEYGGWYIPIEALKELP